MYCLASAKIKLEGTATVHSIVTVMDCHSHSMTGILSCFCASLNDNNLIFSYFVMAHAEINSAALSAAEFTADL